MSRASEGIDRGRFLARTGLGLAAAAFAAGQAGGQAMAAGGTAPTRAAETPAHALELLKEGNARFVAGSPAACGPQTVRRLELAEGQSPFAIVLGCSDSRVPLDTVFDVVPGHIFGVRVAGNFVDANGLGSIEYGVAVLGAPLILVLGHSACGAVGATLKYIENGGAQPGHIQGLIAAIEPAAKAAQGKSGNWLANATAGNVAANVRAMTAQSSIVGDAVKAGKVGVVGGIYNLHTGKVEFLG